MNTKIHTREVWGSDIKAGDTLVWKSGGVLVFTEVTTVGTGAFATIELGVIRYGALDLFEVVA